MWKRESISESSLGLLPAPARDSTREASSAASPLCLPLMLQEPPGIGHPQCLQVWELEDGVRVAKIWSVETPLPHTS